MRSPSVGHSSPRVEDQALLRGRGQFVDDIQIPGTLHLAFVRSPHAHARIASINTMAAQSLSGVVHVWTIDDLPRALQDHPIPLVHPNPAIKQGFLPYVLAKGEVHYVGEPIVVVVADSRARAEDAAELVLVDYEVLPAISDCKDAIEEGAVLCHTQASSNIAARVPFSYGNAAQAFDDAHLVVKESFFQHRGGSFFMECRAGLAQYDTHLDQYTVHLGTQVPHQMKRFYMDMLELGDQQIRVIAPDVGGGFGSKAPFYAEYALLPLLAKATGKPVKWIEDRFENFTSTFQERDQYWDMELALDVNGMILGLQGRLLHDSGAYLPRGLIVQWISATTVPGPYVVPAFQMEMISVLTNRVPTSAVRGAGRPQAIFAMERLLDRAAQSLGIDRAEIRRRNFIQPEQMPYKVGLIYRDGKPVTYDSGDYPGSQDMALKHIDYESFKIEQAKALASGRHIGIGLANYVEGTGLGPYEAVTIRISTTGRVFLYTGAAPQGQSHHTTLAQIAADQLGIDPALITVVTGDTAAVAMGVGTFAARTAVNAGSSAHLAALAVREKIIKIAAAMMEVPEGDLELEDGFVFVRGAQELRKSFREVAIIAGGVPGFSLPDGVSAGLEHLSTFSPKQSTYSNGTHAALVEVDIETGHVKILRYVVVHDCGRVINPKVVHGQVIGGVAHGIGNAFYEHMRYDRQGQPLTTHFGDYLLPMASDMPPIEVLHMTSLSPLNPLGIKGAGEGGTLPAAATLISAVEDALRPYGVKINESPLSPMKVVSLLGVHALGKSHLPRVQPQEPVL